MLCSVMHATMLCMIHRHTTPHHTTPHHTTPHHITSITSHHITSHHITSHHTTPLFDELHVIEEEVQSLRPCQLPNEIGPLREPLGLGAVPDSKVLPPDPYIVHVYIYMYMCRYKIVCICLCRC
jgi:hypothetical protein